MSFCKKQNSNIGREMQVRHLMCAHHLNIFIQEIQGFHMRENKFDCSSTLHVTKRCMKYSYLHSKEYYGHKYSDETLDFKGEMSMNYHDHHQWTISNREVVTEFKIPTAFSLNLWQLISDIQWCTQFFTFMDNLEVVPEHQLPDIYQLLPIENVHEQKKH